MTPVEVARQTLENWIWQGKHASKENFTLTVEQTDDGRDYARLRFVTTTHSYGIRAFPPTGDDPKGYLACEFSEREPRPGETWTRGGDLADGNFARSTWDRIVMDIFSVELAAGAEAAV